jgi:hypothetical protein
MSTLESCKLDKIQQSIELCWKKRFNYYVNIKKRKKKKIHSPKSFTIVDGFFKLKLTLIPSIRCDCPNTSKTTFYCCHILKILTEYFKLSSIVISFLHEPEIYTMFSDLIERNEDEDKYNEILIKTIHDKYSEIECGICIESILYKRFKYRIYHCDNCNNYVHYKCMEKWHSQKLEKKPKGAVHEKNGCVYCRKKADVPKVLFA